ncbi:hypothetical protein EK904_004584 [Melospiza melodia maxima]|nr:hypothetical protein EK904_004584 [Melospiza melodia maxima]
MKIISSELNVECSSGITVRRMLGYQQHSSLLESHWLTKEQADVRIPPAAKAERILIPRDGEIFGC